MAKPLVLIATGGTGGHIFPALAFVENLDKVKYKYLLLADKRFLNFKSQIHEGLQYKIIKSSSLVGGLAQKLFSLLRILIGTIQSLWIIFRLRPIVTVSFGGYPTFPVMVASKLCRVPLIIHEPNALVGLSSRYFVRGALAVSLAFKHTKGVENVDQKKLYYTGNPTRKLVLAARKYQYVKHKKGGKFNILVLGGSQGAKIFSSVIPKAIALLDDKIKSCIRIHQQCRIECMENLKLAYASTNVFAQVKRFFDNVGHEYKWAHLIIARAGALTVSELITVGRPSVLVPFAAAADNHQMANARELEKDKAAWVLSEAEFHPETLAKLLKDLIANPKLLSDYAANAREMFRGSNDSFCKMFESCVQSII